jgi:probable F420-dependent oxidoreductase
MKFTLALAMCPPDHLLPLARAAEDAGWDAITMPDSVFFPEQVSADYPYTEDGSRFWGPETPWVEPFVAIPAMAAVTTRLRFYTNVYKTVLRHPLIVAKSLGSAAALSGNRVGIGLGLSWIPEEFGWLGQEMKTRGKRLDETIEILRAVLAGGYAEHHGDQYDFGRLAMSPSPTEPVPIYVGGHSDPALRRAARLGDGWIAVRVTPDEIDEIMGRLRPLLAEHGRDESAFEIKVTPLVLDEVDAMAALADQGVTDVITVPWFYYEGDNHDLGKKIDGVRRFADEVIQPLAAREGAR